MNKIKNWTGERMESFVQSEVTLEHLHRYMIAKNYVKDKVVLDIASGEGYGTNLLAAIAKEIVGVDISSEAISLAKKKYKSTNLQFKEGRADLIPCKDNYFDVVVSFETLEHHDKHDEMLSEIKRVLKPEGILIISTPDKYYYSDKINYKNEYHIKELYLIEFENLLKKYFNFKALYVQNSGFNSYIRPFKVEAKKFEEYTGDFNHIEKVKNSAHMYLIAICSNFELVNDNVASIFQNDIITKNIKFDVINTVKKSKEFKLGNFILKPLKKLKQRLHN